MNRKIVGDIKSLKPSNKKDELKQIECIFPQISDEWFDSW